MWSPMRMVAGALCAAAGLSSAAQAVAVELELVLAVDASGSVSAAEFDLQTRGLAGAFRDPAVIDANRFAGRRRAIDLSGDGQTNWGRDPDPARDRAVAAGITVNGLAIVNEQPDLARYFREHVIGGPGAFVAVAADYDDVAAAIRLKLIQEIRGAPIGLGPPSPTQWASRKRRRGVRRTASTLDFRPCQAKRGKYEWPQQQTTGSLATRFNPPNGGDFAPA